jgi:hypothetical protein
MGPSYLQAYNIVRTASGTGAGSGPFISYHEGFKGLPAWAGFFPQADRTSLDIHPYLCFQGQSAAGYDQRANDPCTAWGSAQNDSMGAFGLTSAGEWSNALNDCGLWVNGVNLGTRYEGTYAADPSPRIGSCDPWTDWTQWNDTMKQDIQQFAMASMDALQVWLYSRCAFTVKCSTMSNRTGSSGLGKSVTPLSPERLRLQRGHTNSAWRMVGCPRTLVLRQAPAIQLTHG